jgi:hypothetical protein
MNSQGNSKETRKAQRIPEMATESGICRIDQHDHVLFATLLVCVTFFIMATVGSVTRQIAALEISGSNSRAPVPTSSIARPTHTKNASQPNVAKLLTKFAAPNLSKSQTNLANLPPPPPSRKNTTPPAIDIGRYDGGLESENEKRGDIVSGDAAAELALDSSLSRYVKA